MAFGAVISQNWGALKRPDNLTFVLLAFFQFVIESIAPGKESGWQT
ncbi:MAG: hypothetical protein O9295_19055 [Microcystis sp. LE18-22.4A]|nr:hypothetical protein [Microcystis sp. LE18-22.4A]MCZ8120084.1 hypothetical protein [Microcystis sp. LE18-22.4A]